MRIGTSGIPAPTFWDWLEIAHDIGFRWFELPANTGYWWGPGGDVFWIKGAMSIYGPFTLDTGFFAPREFADNKGYPSKDLLEKCETYDMKPCAIYAKNDFVRLDAKELEKEYETMKDLCDLTVRMNCNVLRIHGGTATKAIIDSIGKKRCEELIIQGCKQVIKYAEDRGVSLAIENHLELTNDGDLLLRVMQAVNSEFMGVNIDTGNFSGYGWPPETVKRFFKQLAPYAKHTHIKDGVRTEKGGIHKTHFGGGYYQTPLGDGEVPLKYLMDQLRKTGYKGSYNIQYEVVRWEKHLHGAYEGVRRSYDYLISSL